MAGNIGANPPLGSDPPAVLITLLTEFGQPLARPDLSDRRDGTGALAIGARAFPSARDQRRLLDDVEMDAVAAVALQRPIL
jgi:hypothetical protein